MSWLIAWLISDEPIRDEIKTYENIEKFSTDQRADYTTGCLRNYPYFKQTHKMIGTVLS